MSTLYFVPQVPVAGRYTSWWINEFEKEFKKYFDNVVILGNDIIKSFEIKRDEFNDFSNTEQEILLEIAQVEDYLDIRESINDVLFVSDLSFPGIFANVLYTKRFIGRKYAFCHATSKNKFDIFSDVRDSKFKVETGHAMMFDKIFVGSEYHKNKLNWNNIEVVRLPPPPKDLIRQTCNEKKYDVVSVSRPTHQKVQQKVEDKIEKQLNIKIEKQYFNNPDDYSDFLSQSKVLLISSREDTFNYTIMDAIKCKCIPIAPNDLCFPEILPQEYLYNNPTEASILVRRALLGKLPVPKMLCENEVNIFYDYICNMMLDRRSNIICRGNL